MIRVLVSGASGRMGREVCRGVLGDPDLRLVGALDVANVGVDIGKLLGDRPAGLKITDDAAGVISGSRPDVLVDFSTSAAVIKTARLAVEAGVHLVIGTTGMASHEVDELHTLAEETGTGILLAPNFALGAVLMIHFAGIAARYLPHVEIVEMHHDQKVDAPSGTALKTADVIVENRTRMPDSKVQEHEKLPGSRGGNYEGIRVHSVRLPGYIAHQEVIFGGMGQTLSLRHDSTSREAFIPGVLLAIKEVGRLRGFTYGLEHLLNLEA